ncbi:hypothetical protein PGT21_019108 [Puccinia graminis f. sp. tritici]|uniref:Uncharacterized protein n=1 Tax=Puccinia graminis f. sp. tritici TaxID=56615 RepID=A0A5B0RJB5_PUCGR|nr:hypothetical protein PGT21_019108 [Puccinia graminis f. sp. tritici]KAA1125880.1 hypothetical protein PGTUg99_014629 [Puccinia graminis f. sp. tritici]
MRLDIKEPLKNSPLKASGDVCVMAHSARVDRVLNPVRDFIISLIIGVFYIHPPNYPTQTSYYLRASISLTSSQLNFSSLFSVTTNVTAALDKQTRMIHRASNKDRAR